MRVLKSALIMSALFLVAGCGGSNDSTPECGLSASCLPPQLYPAVSIVGLWDSSVAGDSQQNILYTFIGERGEYLVYDYEQDDFGSGANCHTLNEGSIYRYSDSSSYTIEYAATESNSVSEGAISATIFLQNGSLEFRREGGVVEEWPPVVGLSKDDLELCQ